MPSSLRKDCLFNIIVGTYKSYVIKEELWFYLWNHDPTQPLKTSNVIMWKWVNSVNCIITTPCNIMSESQHNVVLCFCFLKGSRLWKATVYDTFFGKAHDHQLFLTQSRGRSHGAFQKSDEGISLLQRKKTHRYKQHISQGFRRFMTCIKSHSKSAM